MNPAIFSVKPVGLSWTKNQITAVGSPVYYDISYNGTAFVITGNNGGGSAVILSATNPASTWTSRTPVTSAAHLYAVANNGSRFVAIGGTSANPGVYSDDNGATWALNGIHSASWRGLCYGGGQFVAVANTGGGTPLASTSTDGGATWTSRTIPTADWEDVFYGNGLYVAVGQNGAIATSPDGITWTSRTSGTTDVLYRVRYKAGLWLAVGAPGGGGAATILTSPDGITWTNVTSPANAETFQGLCVHKNWFIAGTQASTYSGQIWRSISATNPTWKSSTTGVPSSCNVRGIASNGSQIVALYNASGDNGVLVSS